MEASIVDLRYRMKEILRALDKNQNVTILYRGKIKATLIPMQSPKKGRTQDHAFFGMLKQETSSVQEVMQHLRGGRY